MQYVYFFKSQGYFYNENKAHANRNQKHLCQRNLSLAYDSALHFNYHDEFHVIRSVFPILLPCQEHPLQKLNQNS